MSFIQLNEDEFEAQFKPVENLEKDRGVYQFDAYNEKDSGFLQFMAINYPAHVWTRIDGDDGRVYNINGWHIANRIDYVVTEVPWLEHHDYEALDYLPCRNFTYLSGELSMDEKELITDGVGDVPEWLADEGLELAVAYFEDNELNPQACFEAVKNESDSELESHWYKAEKQANRVLLSNSRYDNSIITLDFRVY